LARTAGYSMRRDELPGPQHNRSRDIARDDVARMLHYDRRNWEFVLPSTSISSQSQKSQAL
jgi:hypothetical protein